MSVDHWFAVIGSCLPSGPTHHSAPSELLQQTETHPHAISSKPLLDTINFYLKTFKQYCFLKQSQTCVDIWGKKGRLKFGLLVDVLGAIIVGSCLLCD